jgi:hypothetical protein
MESVCSKKVISRAPLIKLMMSAAAAEMNLPKVFFTA